MSRRRMPDDGYGLSAAEEAIVARLEAGESHGAIATSLGFALGTIAVIGRRYILSERQLGAFDRRCRQGEAKYRAALAGTGKVYA